MGPIPGWPACCGSALLGLFPIPFGPVPNPLGLGPPVPIPFESPAVSFLGMLSFVGVVGVLLGKVPWTGSFDVGLKYLIMCAKTSFIKS